MLVVKLIIVQTCKLRAKAGYSISSITHQPESYSVRQHDKAAWKFSGSWSVQQHEQPQQSSLASTWARRLHELLRRLSWQYR